MAPESPPRKFRAINQFFGEYQEKFATVLCILLANNIFVSKDQYFLSGYKAILKLPPV